jgi:hypothetical protein
MSRCRLRVRSRTANDRPFIKAATFAEGPHEIPPIRGMRPVHGKLPYEKPCMHQIEIRLEEILLAKTKEIR